MHFSVSCLHCHEEFDVQKDWIGMEAECPTC